MFGQPAWCYIFHVKDSRSSKTIHVGDVHRGRDELLCGTHLPHVVITLWEAAGVSERVDVAFGNVMSDKSMNFVFVTE